jgi:hypothetical protein
MSETFGLYRYETRAQMMSGFGQLYAGNLRDHPEFAQIWKNVAQKRKEW